jgi:hypothetical protein
MLPKHLKMKIQEEKQHKSAVTDYDFVEDAMYALERDCTQTAEILRRKMPKPKRQLYCLKFFFSTTTNYFSDPAPHGGRVPLAYDTKAGRFPVGRAGARPIRKG